MKIELTEGFDRYKIGDMPVRIICIDAPGENPVIAMDGYGSLYFRYSDGSKLELSSITEVFPWGDFKDGDPVMVRDSGNQEWHRRYFYKEENGLPACYVDGTTKWSGHGRLYSVWTFCRRPTKEELEE